MSLRAFNGSIANPAQTAVNLGGNSLSNADELSANFITASGNVESGNAVVISSDAGFDYPRLEMKGGSTGATGAGYITFFPNLLRFEASQEVYGRAAVGGSNLYVKNANDLQVLSFDNSSSHGPTGSISYVPSDVRFTCDQNFDINGTCSVGGAFQALDTLSAGGLAQFNANIFLNNIGTDTPIISLTNGATGASQCAISYFTTQGILNVDRELRVGTTDATAKLSFSTSANQPLLTTYNATSGMRTYAQVGNNTFIFGATGATGATPFLKVDGVLGEGRVFDSVYNPPPTIQTYGQFSMNTTQGVGATSGATGVANTATQLQLDTTVINEGCTRTNGGIEVYNTGKYLITVSPQFYNTGSGNHNVYFWFRVNSTDVANSSTGVYMQGNAAQIVPTVSVVLDLTSADIVKIMAAADDSNIQVLNVASQSSPYSRPAAPAIIATITRLA